MAIKEHSAHDVVLELEARQNCLTVGVGERIGLMMWHYYWGEKKHYWTSSHVAPRENYQIALIVWILDPCGRWGAKREIFCHIYQH